MKYLKIVVLVIAIIIMGCLQGFINFDFEEVDVFITFAFPMLYALWLHIDGRKSENDNQEGT